MVAQRQCFIPPAPGGAAFTDAFGNFRLGVSVLGVVVRGFNVRGLMSVWFMSGR